MTECTDHRIEDACLDHAIALKGLARGLLAKGGASGAMPEDLVQGAFVAGLQQQPEQRGPGLYAWLSLVTRRMAMRLRRSERRRAEREDVAGQQRDVVAAATVDVVAETEMMARIAAAVRALAEPYRSVVYLRYWRDLSPTEIAQLRGVPRNTVRSQLQRGLAQLRGQLDADYGDRAAWVACLPPALTAPIGATSVSLAVGVLTMKLKWIAAACLAVAATTLAWWGMQPAVPLPNSGASGAAVAPLEGVDVADAADASPRRSAAESVGRSGVAAVDSITFTGRCVDAVTGAPRSGCSVRVRGRLQYWEPDVSFPEPDVVRSDAAGRFVVRCRAIAPRMELVVRAPDSVEMSAWWGGLRMGAHKDVGDVRIESGCRVSGRVVDTAGVPQSGVAVSFLGKSKGYTRNEGRIAATGQCTVRSDGTGGFGLRLSAEEWIWTVEEPHRQRVLIPPPTIRIRPDQVDVAVEVEVLRKLASISGVVVDAAGGPVAGARVRIPAPETSELLDLEVRTGRAGTFDLPRLEDWPADAVAVVAKRFGYVATRAGEPVAWGTNNLRLTLRPIATAVQELVVVDADTGAPIEEFGVRFGKDPQGSGSYGAQHDRAWRKVRHRGRHAGGRLAFRVPLGAQLITVVPTASDRSTPQPRRVSITSAPPAPLRFALARDVTRGVRVVDASGRPVADAKIELLEEVAVPVTLTREVVDMDSFPYALSWRKRALRRGEQISGADGRATLTAAPGRYSLRLLGPVHVPKVVRDVEVAPGLGEFRVVVDRGAEIVGQLGPAPALARLLPRGGLAESAKTTASFRPHVRFYNLENRRYFPPGRDRIEVDATGKFRAASVPPGSYSVRFVYTYQTMEVVCWSTAEVGRLENLASGERHEVAYDVQSIVPARLRGRVELDGRPYGKQMLRLLNVADGGPVIVDSPLHVATDAAGAFAIDLPPGRYLATISADIAGRSSALHSAASLSAKPGQVVEHTFALQRTRVRVRILTDDGKPVADREFLASAPRCWRKVGRTDANGVLVLNPAPVHGPFELVTWPQRYSDPAKRRDLRRANPKGWKSELLRAGPIVCPTGVREHKVELRLRRSGAAGAKSDRR